MKKYKMSKLVVAKAITKAVIKWTILERIHAEKGRKK